MLPNGLIVIISVQREDSGIGSQDVKNSGLDSQSIGDTGLGSQNIRLGSQSIGESALGSQSDGDIKDNVSIHNFLLFNCTITL